MKISWAQIITGMFAIERIHSSLKQFVPQYSTAADHLIDEVKRKIGFKQTLMDDITDFLGDIKEKDDLICNHVMQGGSVDDFIRITLAKDCEIQKIVSLEKDTVEKLTDPTVSVRESLLKCRDFSQLNEKEYDNIYLYRAVNSLDDWDPDKQEYILPGNLKKDDALKEILIPKKRLWFSNSAVFFTYQEKKGVVIFARSTQQNITDLKVVMTFLYSRKNPLCDFVSEIEFAAAEFNQYAGCILRFRPGEVNNSPVIHSITDQTLDLRLLERDIDSSVYDATTIRAVENDIVSFTQKASKENSVYKRRSYLLVGPPGCGKSQLIQDIISKIPIEYTVVFVEPNTVHALTDLVDKHYSLFPIVLIIEDVDLVIEKTKEKQILLNFLDGCLSQEKLITIMTANNPSVLGHVFLRRPGRVDRVIKILPGQLAERVAQLKKLCNDVTLEISFEELAEETEGFTFAQHRELIERAKLYSDDIKFLEKKSLLCALEECKDQFSLEMQDWSLMLDVKKCEE